LFAFKKGCERRNWIKRNENIEKMKNKIIRDISSWYLVSAVSIIDLGSSTSDFKEQNSISV